MQKITLYSSDEFPLCFADYTSLYWSDKNKLGSFYRLLLLRRPLRRWLNARQSLPTCSPALRLLSSQQPRCNRAHLFGCSWRRAKPRLLLGGRERDHINIERFDSSKETSPYLQHARVGANGRTGLMLCKLLRDFAEFRSGINRRQPGDPGMNCDLTSRC